MAASALLDYAHGRVNTPRARVALADALSIEVQLAAREVVKLDLARPVLVGDPHEIGLAAQENEVELAGIDILDPADPEWAASLVDSFCSENPSFPRAAAQRMLVDPLYAAAAALRRGDADAMVAGLTHPTAEVLMACHTVLGLSDELETPSSVFVMEVPEYDGPEGPLLAFADCAVVPAPDATQLADIVISTAKTVRDLLRWEPRVALLSFSTRGSGHDASVDRVLEALSLVQDRAPDLAVDGELQVDAALVPEIAAGKLEDDSSVAGRANVLVFPDLNAGNIGYKLVQRLCGARAYGPVLQGFTARVCDLSRGATLDDVLGAILLSSVRVDDQE